MEQLKLIYHKLSLFQLITVLLLATGAEICLDLLFGDNNGVISHPLLSWVLSFLYIGLVSLLILKITELSSVKTNLNRLFSLEIYNSKVNSKGLSIMRVVFSFISLLFFIQSYDFIEVINFDKSDDYIAGLFRFYPIFLISLLLIGFGWLGMWPYIIVFVYASSIMHGDVGTHLYAILSFWLIFSGASNNHRLLNFTTKKYLKKLSILDYQPKGEKIVFFLLGLNISFITTAAGISKCLDPIWLDGMGFYYTFLQPWIKLDYFSPISESKFLMVTMNYMTIISEALTLPLFLFRRTRKIAVLLILAMYFQLTFPFRIDAIGPFGLLIGGFLFIAFFLENNQFEIEQSKKSSYFNFKYYLYSGLIVWLSSSFLFSVYDEFNNGKLRYPRVEYPFALKGELDKSVEKVIANSSVFHIPVVFHMSDFIFGILPLKRIVKISPIWYSPFNFYHFFGRVYYKIKLDFEDGSSDSYKIFNENGTQINSKYTGGILKDRVIQNRIWASGMIYHRLAYYQADSAITEQLNLEIKALFNFILRTKSQTKRVESLSLYIREIKVPGKYEGETSPWEDIPWHPLLKYSVDSEQLSVIQFPTLTDFKHINHPLFSDETIYFKPD